MWGISNIFGKSSTAPQPCCMAVTSTDVAAMRRNRIGTIMRNCGKMHVSLRNVANLLIKLNSLSYKLLCDFLFHFPAFHEYFWKIACKLCQVQYTFDSSKINRRYDCFHSGQTSHLRINLKVLQDTFNFLKF